MKVMDKYVSAVSFFFQMEIVTMLPWSLSVHALLLRVEVFPLCLTKHSQGAESKSKKQILIKFHFPPWTTGAKILCRNV